MTCSSEKGPQGTFAVPESNQSPWPRDFRLVAAKISPKAYSTRARPTTCVRWEPATEILVRSGQRDQHPLARCLAFFLLVAQITAVARFYRNQSLAAKGTGLDHVSGPDANPSCSIERRPWHCRSSISWGTSVDRFTSDGQKLSFSWGITESELKYSCSAASN